MKINHLDLLPSRQLKASATAVDGYDERSHERSKYEGFSNNYTVNYPMTLEQFNWDHDRVHNSGYAYYGHFTQVIWMNSIEVGCLICASTRVEGLVG